jgi:hypothetical protein
VSLEQNRKEARRREQEGRREIQLSIVENSLHTMQSSSRRDSGSTKGIIEDRHLFLFCFSLLFV